LKKVFVDLQKWIVSTSDPNLVANQIQKWMGSCTNECPVCWKHISFLRHATLNHQRHSLKEDLLLQRLDSEFLPRMAKHTRNTAQSSVTGNNTRHLINGSQSNKLQFFPYKLQNKHYNSRVSHTLLSFLDDKVSVSSAASGSCPLNPIDHEARTEAK
jgi:hypothetical protein